MRSSGSIFGPTPARPVGATLPVAPPTRAADRHAARLANAARPVTSALTSFATRRVDPHITG
ncbi:hypothetical protein OEM_26040 [Mycobacterium intracellulare subsp. yongonense 05-1390]|nr:hypothetical protein OEM_26040 [Mycobacterium intracellulare subsp. yongonense 05-1390]ARR78269.1 hypothetical protein MOTT12_02605 [Mycobacterium intracellulare subsp. yongonense]